MSGRHPYSANGYSNSNASNVYDDPYTPDNNASSDAVNDHGGRDRRARGWGALGEAMLTEASEQTLQSRAPYGTSEHGDWRRRLNPGPQGYGDTNMGRERAGSRYATNGAQHYGSRTMGKSMEDILSHIQSDWKFMGGDECVPVQVALQLMDPSTLGLHSREPEFQQTHIDLQQALKSIVNEHHQDFNSSIGTYHKIQSSIQSSQSRVRYLKNALSDTKGGLLTMKPELKGLATSSQGFDDTLQLLGQIETIQAIPERLEGRISEKRFLAAVDVLQEALRLVRRSDLDGMGAISDLRTYFTNQAQSLTDILIEELHDHLYLKSPYCQGRWRAISTNGAEKDPRIIMTSTGVNPWDKPVYHYLSHLDTSSPMTEDASRNPEADTFYYMHMIIESLNRLGHLEVVVGRVEQRLPVELFKVVEKTNHEIDARYPGHIRGHTGKGKGSLVMPTDPPDGRGAVLSDFLWTVYAKFEAIAEGHRVLHEVVSGIVVREKVPKPENYIRTFNELWELYQSEMRALLHDYLATDGDMTQRAGRSNAQSGDVFSRSQRDKSKRMFRLGEMDQKSTEMKSEQEGLAEILKSSVPGLVTKSSGNAGAISEARPSAHESTAAGHKLLIEPSVFNVTLLLPPSLSFLQHLGDIVPASANIPMNALTSFLDDFLINVFHPQLEEAVTDLCSRCIIDLEAFTEDPQWPLYSPRPIFKGTIAFMSLVHAFSTMLNTIPEDDVFTKLITSQLQAYMEKCDGWYRALVSRLSASSPSTTTKKAAAAYADKGDIRDITIDLLNTEQDLNTHSTIIDKEIHLLLSTTRAHPLSPYDIISDPKSVVSLSLLYNSMQWLHAALSRLRHVDPSPHRTIRAHSRSASKTNSRRWTLFKPGHIRTQSASAAGDTATRLSMNSESVIPFDETLSSFRSLATTVLLTLHIDLRCGVLFQLTRSLRGHDVATLDQTSYRPSSDSAGLPTADSGSNPWVLHQPPTTTSPLILDLNKDLISFDTNISSYLGPKERAFISAGLARLIDKALVTEADKIGAMNANGAQRLCLDILVLQQNLRNIVVAEENNNTDTDETTTILGNSARFFNLFLQGPQSVLEFARENKQKTEGEGEGEGQGGGYNFEELRTLIELCYSARLRSKEREDNVRAKKGLQDDLLQLTEIMWDSN